MCIGIVGDVFLALYRVEECHPNNGELHGGEDGTRFLKWLGA